MYLTARQKEIYEFLKDYIARKGEAPTYQEIGRALHLRSTNAVAKHLKKLEEKGYVRSPWGNRKRALRLVEHGTPSFTIPLLGTVAAGKPIEPIEGTEKMIERAGQFCKSGGWTLIKASKPNQDMRFDVPCVGPDTIKNLAQNGAKCLAVEADKTIIIDKPQTIKLADELGIVVLGL